MSHAATRARERIGLEFESSDFRAIWEKIDDGRAIFMRRGKRSTLVYALTLHGKALCAVVDPITRCVITVWERPGKHSARARRS